jgi:DNA repair photolyase
VYADMDEASRPQTTVTEEHARSIVTRNDSPDIGFAASVNPYRGCEHGCVYCFARPSHAYLDLSPGLDFETKLFAKTNAGRSACARSWRGRPIAARRSRWGINTDAYQPIERRYRITRQCLEVLAETKHPLSFITKSALIERDIDLLARWRANAWSTSTFSITTLDNNLAGEDGTACLGAARQAARDEGACTKPAVPVGVMAAPMIPMINDRELEHILEAAYEHGARAAGYVLLRLPHELKQIWREWLELHYPDRAAHVMSLVQQMRGGKDYDSAFGKRMRGEGPFAQLLQQRFAKAYARIGFGRLSPLDSSRFTPPRPLSPQGELF